MAGGRDLLTRLDTVAEALESLHGVLASQETLDEALSQVARNAVRAVVDADAVSITVLDEPSSRTVACTEEFVLALDATQYSTGQGPCLEAARTGRLVRAAMSSPEQPWPDFVAAARGSGVRSTLSIPLVIDSEDGDGTALAGSLNAYSRRTPEFDPVDEKLLSLYTSVAAQAITIARKWKGLRQKVSQLEDALVSRTDIDQAKGALRVLYGVSAEDAFAKLVERSQRENVKVRTLAQQTIEELSRNVPPQ